MTHEQHSHYESTEQSQNPVYHKPSDSSTRFSSVQMTLNPGFYPGASLYDPVCIKA